MSLQSRQKHPKQKNPTIRKDLKAQALRDKNRVLTVTNPGEKGERREMLPARFNLTPGHRDLGLIPKNLKHGQRLQKGGSIKGCFGGKTKEARLKKFREDAMALTQPA